MTDIDELPTAKGLIVGTKAPLINTLDLYGNEVNLSKLLETYNGVMIDFFRGNW